MAVSNKVVKRIKYVPQTDNINSIDWPYNLRPTAQPSALNYDGTLPAADVIVMPYTEAESYATADVLTPGQHAEDYIKYAHNYSDYEQDFTNRSPAKDSGYLATFWMTKIGAVTVMVLKSNLHPATDGPELPLAKLAAQVAQETQCEMFITTGTAGGAGNGTNLGDVNVANLVKADFTTRLANQAYSQGVWTPTAPSAQQNETLNVASQLILANSNRLPPANRQPKIWQGANVSTDFFAYDTENDAYGLRKVEPSIRSVEMDDAAVFYGLQEGFGNVDVFCVRNASDPVMPDNSAANAKKAEQIYREYGYWTTVNSSLACWALVAGMSANV